VNTIETENLIRTVLHQVAPDADLADLADDDDIRDTLGLDSLDFLQVVELLSERSGVRIDEEDYPQLSTLNSGRAWLAAAAR
jgi:acyl carrier protein